MYKATDLVIKVFIIFLLISIDEPTLSLRLVEAADRDGFGCRPVCRNVNRIFRLMTVIIEVNNSFAADFLKTKIVK